MNARRLRWMTALALSLACAGAWAQECHLGASGIDFGEYLPQPGATLDGIGSLTVTCNNPTPNPQYLTVCIGFRAGTGGGGGNQFYLPHADPGNSSRLTYRFSKTPDMNQPWIYGSPQRMRITAQLPAGAGDTVIATPALYGRITGFQGTPVPGQYFSDFLGPQQIAFTYTPSTSGYLATCPGGGTSPNVEAFTNTATVPHHCEISAGPGTLDFGAVNDLTAQVSATFAMQVHCTASTPYSIALDDGQFPAAPGHRRMRNTIRPEHHISYEIFQNADFSTRWGHTSSGPTGMTLAGLTGQGLGTDQAYTGHGLVPAQPVPSVGTYQDTVVVTVAW